GVGGYIEFSIGQLSSAPQFIRESRFGRAEVGRILLVIVQDAWQHKGVGTELTKRCLKHIKKTWPRTFAVYVTVAPNNTYAAKMYIAAGFKFAERGSVGKEVEDYYRYDF
ncbi:hypothetical protein FOL47_004047, partial [Perkinsus chesapeaki]